MSCTRISSDRDTCDTGSHRLRSKFCHSMSCRIVGLAGGRRLLRATWIWGRKRSWTLLTELRSRVNAGSGEATLEICMILASQKKWKDAVPVALLMADRLKTAESVRLACIVLYNARSFQECLDLLDRGRSSFPHSELPNELVRMKISVQSELGLLPAAVAAAEQIFQASATAANFLALARLYFTKGDLASLAILARKHSMFEELTSTELLRLAAHLADQDRTLAVDLWKRAMAGTIPDAEVTAAMSIGYRLGMDRQLRPSGRKHQ
jgi:hypothetical protein